MIDLVYKYIKSYYNYNTYVSRRHRKHLPCLSRDMREIENSQVELLESKTLRFFKNSLYRINSSLENSEEKKR